MKVAKIILIVLLYGDFFVRFYKAIKEDDRGDTKEAVKTISGAFINVAIYTTLFIFAGVFDL